MKIDLNAAGVQPVLSAKDMADKNVEHLGVMAYAAHYQWIPERPPLFDLISVRLESTSGRVGEPVSEQIFKFKISKKFLF